jgi:hypothetical protein
MVAMLIINPVKKKGRKGAICQHVNLITIYFAFIELYLVFRILRILKQLQENGHI